MTKHKNNIVTILLPSVELTFLCHDNAPLHLLSLKKQNN